MLKVLKPLFITVALGAGNAFAFYGTTIENHRPNPWLDRPLVSSEARLAQDATASAGATRQARDERASAGATRPSEEPRVPSETRARTELDRFFAQSDRTSRFSGAF
jgi:hypothetical protein